MNTVPHNPMDAVLWEGLGAALDTVLTGNPLEPASHLLIKAFRLYQEVQKQPDPYCQLNNLSDCYYAVVDASGDVIRDKLNDPHHAYDFD